MNVSKTRGLLDKAAFDSSPVKVSSPDELVSAKYTIVSQSIQNNKNYKDKVFKRSHRNRSSTLKLKPYDLTATLDFSKLTISSSKSCLQTSEEVVKPKSRSNAITPKTELKNNKPCQKSLPPFKIAKDCLDFATLAAEIKELERDTCVPSAEQRLNNWTELRDSLPNPRQCFKKESLRQKSSANHVLDGSLLRSCSQEAKLNELDFTMEELASYFDELVYIPKKMSEMAEMMYT